MAVVWGKGALLLLMVRAVGAEGRCATVSEGRVAAPIGRLLLLLLMLLLVHTPITAAATEGKWAR